MKRQGYKFKHTHGNHIPKVLRKTIKRLENIAGCTKLIIGQTYNHRHKGTPGNVQFQRESERKDCLKFKGFTPDGSVDLFIFGDKKLILKEVC